MDTVAVRVPVPDREHATLLVAFSRWDANGFLQDDDVITAYLPVEAWTDERAAQLREWLTDNGYAPDAVDVDVLNDHNWNEQWERSITPIRVGGFFVKPTWATVPDDAAALDVIEVDPKMSFGTGHHATTRLMLRLMREAVRPGDVVLDAGSGTGILSIAACRVGAARTVAFDVDDKAYENAQETLALNGVADRVDVRRGTLDVVPEDGFDVILANITREVLLEMLPGFADKLVPGGHLALAGVFASDREQMRDATAQNGFRFLHDAHEGDWWAGLWTRE